MTRLLPVPVAANRRSVTILLWTWLGVLLIAAVCGWPDGAARVRGADAAEAVGTASAPAATAPSVYHTLAGIASPEARKAGLADLVAAEIAQNVPGVRLVERERLDAAVGELSAATLLG